MRYRVDIKDSAAMNEKTPNLNISPQFSKTTVTWFTTGNSGDSELGSSAKIGIAQITKEEPLFRKRKK